MCTWRTVDEFVRRACCFPQRCPARGLTSWCGCFPTLVFIFPLKFGVLPRIPFFHRNLIFAVIAELAKNSGVRLRVEVSFGCRWTYFEHGQLVEYVTHSGRVRETGILPPQIYSARGLTSWFGCRRTFFIIYFPPKSLCFFSWHRLTRFSFLAVSAMSTHSSLFFSSASACELPVLCPVNEPQRQPIGEARLRGALKNARVQHHRKLIVPGKRAPD